MSPEGGRKAQLSAVLPIAVRSCRQGRKKKTQIRSGAVHDRTQLLAPQRVSANCLGR